MFCPKCGNEINPKKPFCPDCGEKIKIPEKKEVEKIPEESVEYYTGPANGFSVTGLIIGAISIILGIILLVLVTTGRNLNWGNVITFIVLGLLSGILSITGLVLSIVGMAKKKDAFGIIGIILSTLTIILDFITVLVFITTLD